MVLPRPERQHLARQPLVVKKAKDVEPPRRKRGSGSRTKRPDGRWQCQWRGPAGRRSWTVDSLAQADAELDRLVELRRRGLTRDPRAEPLGAYLERWLPKRLVKRAPATRETYARRLDRWAALARVPVGHLTAEAVDAESTRLLERGMGHDEFRQCRALLKSALRELVPTVLAGNPVGPFALPRRQRRRLPCWPPDVARRFVAAIRGDRHETLYLLALATGMREGELVSVWWDDVAPDYRRIRVWRNVSLDEPGDTKDHAERTVELDERMALVLRRHRARQRPGEQLLFPSARGRAARDGRYTTAAIRKAFRLQVRALGLPYISFHGLRHTFATLSLEAGKPLPAVSEMLGHYKPSFTAELYWWLLPGQQADVARAMGDVLFGAGRADRQRSRQRGRG